MKRFKLMLVALLLMVGVSALGVRLASAHSFQTGDNVVRNDKKPINQTVFLAGRTIDFHTEVYGDVFCAGQNVTISATVHGDVICAGQNVDISGKVIGNVRLAGQNVKLSAKVSGNATVGGQSFLLTSEGAIAGDATVGSSDASFNGPVGRDVAVGGERVVITNFVGRDVKSGGTNLELQKGADIKGNVDQTSKQDVVKASGAVVGGKITRHEPEQKKAPKRGAVFGFGIGLFVYLFAAMLLTSMVIALLFPRMLFVVTDKAMPRPWKALLTGFIASFAVPIAIILMMVTVIGLPLAFLAGITWLVALTLSGPLFAFYIGRKVLKSSNHPLQIMLVGSAILLVLYFIPVIGFLALLAAGWIGTGVLLLESFQRYPKPSYRTSAEAPKKTTSTKK